MSATSPPHVRMALRLSEVTIRRGAGRIVDGLDLHLLPGRIFWVVGPNGAGKSSLLRVVVGLDRPAAGTVTWSGAGPQSPGYFHSEMGIPGAARVRDWERLVAALVERSARTAGAPVPPRTSLWPAVASGRRIGRLSTGERKRLLLDPLLRRTGPIVLDEPFEHLSPDARTRLHHLLRERARHDLVVVATNEAVDRADDDGGLRLRDGVATPLTGGGPA